MAYKSEPVESETDYHQHEHLFAPDYFEEDDPVVDEFPVYLNHDLTGQLHLLQCQNRPLTFPFGDDEVLDVKFRPGSKKLQIITEINTKSKFYDSIAGVQLATGKSTIDIIENVDGILDDLASMDQHPEKDLIINKQTMEYDANPLSEESGCYYVCLKRKNAIHVTPIESVGQFRPIYPALDIEDLDTSMEGKDAGTDASESEAESEDAGKIQVKFKHDKKVVHTAAENREALLSQYYTKHLEQEIQDSWIRLEYSDFNEEVWQKLRTNNDELEAEATETARTQRPAEAILREEDEQEPMLVDLEPGVSNESSGKRRMKQELHDSDSEEDLDSSQHFLRCLVSEHP